MRGGPFLALVPAAVALAGCGGDAVSLDPVASAATRTEEAGSSRIEITVATGGRENYSSTGEVEYGDPPRVHLVVRGLEGEHPGAPRAPLELILVEGTSYVKGLPGLPAGKTWVSFDEAASPSVEDFYLGDPSQLLDFLRATSDVEELGEDLVRGVETTHYRASVDLEKVVEQAPEAKRAELRKDLAWREEKTLSVEAWIDDEGLARRLRALTGADDATMTIEFFDFGIEVAAEPPPAGEVATEDEWFRTMPDPSDPPPIGGKPPAREPSERKP